MDKKILEQESNYFEKSKKIIGNIIRTNNSSTQNIDNQMAVIRSYI